MILLQAALGYGMLMMMVFGGGIFVGIPIVSWLLYNFLSKDIPDLTHKEKIRIGIKSLGIATVFIAVILGLLCIFLLNTIDLTYS